MKCFVIDKEMIKDRCDPFYYQPVFLDMEKKLQKGNFKTRTLGDIAEDIKNGTTPSGGNFEKEGIPFFRSQDFSLDGIEVNQYIRQSFHKKLERSKVIPGDILVAVVGATIGMVGYVPEEIREGNINQNVARVRVKREFNSKYITIYLSTKFGQAQLIRNATLTTQRYLNTPQLNSIKVPIPPREMQDEIVKIIEDAYKKRNEQLKEARELLDSIENYFYEKFGIQKIGVKEKRKFIVSYEDLKGKRFDVFHYQPKFQNLLELFRRANITTRPLGDFIELINYGASIKACIEGEIPFLRIQNLKENKLVLDELLYVKKNELNNSDYIQEGDFLISRSGTVGIVARVPKEANGYAFGSFMIRFRLKEDNTLNPNFVWLFLNHKLGRMQSTMSKTGGVQGNITIPAIKNIQIPILNITKQLSIIQEVLERQRIAKNLEEKANQIIIEANGKVEKIILGTQL